MKKQQTKQQEKDQEFAILRKLGDNMTLAIRAACSDNFGSSNEPVSGAEILVSFTILFNQFEAMPLLTRQFFVEKLQEFVDKWDEDWDDN